MWNTSISLKSVTFERSASSRSFLGLYTARAHTSHNEFFSNRKKFPFNQRGVRRRFFHLHTNELALIIFLEHLIYYRLASLLFASKHWHSMCCSSLNVQIRLYRGRHYWHDQSPSTVVWSLRPCRWEPLTASVNSNTVRISIIQSYAWVYPTILCANDVPISTPSRSSTNANLVCIADCSTDGNYFGKPVDILTDCVSTSAPLSIMSSIRSKNDSLNAGAHFYLSYQYSAWIALNDPGIQGLSWSITTFIDLRLRPDGIINTPPEVVVASPQYAIVNQTTQISIPLSDTNAGDTVRCRWSKVIPGYRRRRREDNVFHHEPASNTQKDFMANRSRAQTRVKQKSYSDPCTSYCYSRCWNKCPCRCSSCTGTTCSGSSCKAPKSTCASGTTTPETPGTLPTTSLFPSRQAIDECGDICYPGSVPTGTTLSNCTLTFKGLVPDTWYAVAIQVTKVCWRDDKYKFSFSHRWKTTSTRLAMFRWVQHRFSF